MACLSFFKFFKMYFATNKYFVLYGLLNSREYGLTSESSEQEVSRYSSATSKNTDRDYRSVQDRSLLNEKKKLSKVARGKLKPSLCHFKPLFRNTIFLDNVGI